MTVSNRHRLFSLVAVMAAMAAAAASPNVWYVKASNYGLDGLTGRDEEHAWGTLQQAHDAASAGEKGVTVFTADLYGAPPYVFLSQEKTWEMK